MAGVVMANRGGNCRGGSKGIGKVIINGKHNGQSNNDSQQVSVLEILVAAIRKSLVSCRIDGAAGDDGFCQAVHHMEISWPTNVQHITHVTFDRFNGFLGLPVEFEIEIPYRVPSASASVFGVSAESMQCSYDVKGNSVPTILLLMQERLYSQGGLKAEGIFRINPENGQEEHVRSQLNKGIVPDNIDVHCLASLIKAWLRELPSGVLDGLSPEEVLRCNTEEESLELVKQLKPTEFALLNWVVELMADVVEEEEINKMNARNIAMVFAPNMTQMTDPLTALMHAVQVMNLLKTLITRTLKDRDEAGSGGYSPLSSRSSMAQSEEDFDSQPEMDTSGELRRRQSPVVYNNPNYIPDTEDRVDIDSLSEVEDCFLRQLDPPFIKLAEQSIEVPINFSSPTTCYACKTDSGSPSSSITSEGEASASTVSMVPMLHMIDDRTFKENDIPGAGGLLSRPGLNGRRSHLPDEMY